MKNTCDEIPLGSPSAVWGTHICQSALQLQTICYLTEVKWAHVTIQTFFHLWYLSNLWASEVWPQLFSPCSVFLLASTKEHCEESGRTIPVLISWWVALSASCKSEDKASLWGLQLNPQTTMFQIWFTGALMIPDRALSWCLNSMLTVECGVGCLHQDFHISRRYGTLALIHLKLCSLSKAPRKSMLVWTQCNQLNVPFASFVFSLVGRGGLSFQTSTPLVCG